MKEKSINGDYFEQDKWRQKNNKPEMEGNLSLFHLTKSWAKPFYQGEELFPLDPDLDYINKCICTLPKYSVVNLVEQINGAKEQ